MSMTLEEFKKKLSSFTLHNIQISSHALLRAEVRGISQKEIFDNILNPRRLKAFTPESGAEQKYACWFEYSKNLGHKYIVIINGNLLVVTVIKIRRRWQRRVESHVKKIQN